MANPVVDTPIPDQSDTDLASVSLDISGNFSDADVTDTLTYTIQSGLPIGTGFTIDSLTGVFSGTATAADEAAQPLNVVVRCTDGSGNFNEATAQFLLPAAPATDYVNSRNISGMVTNASSNWLHDPTQPHYLCVRTVNTVLFQPRDLWRPQTRSRWVDEFNHINHINPLSLCLLHQAPLHNTPGFRTKRQEKSGPYTWYAQNTTNRDGGIDRKDAMLSIDGTDNDLLQTNSQTSTTNKAKQAGWTLRVTNPQFRSYMADVAIDALCGTNRSGYDMGGGNMANFMVYWHDGTDVLNPKSGARLRRVAAQGTIDSILELKTSKPQQPIQVRIDDDPAFPTTGTLPEDSSYGETDEAHAFWCYPPTGTKGFIGYHVIGYKAASGGKADLYLKELSKIAHDDQYHVPEAGWKYCLNDQASGHNNPDWDGDGVNLDQYTVESWAHAAALKDYWDEINAGVLEVNGTNTMRTANALSSSLVQKRVAGLPHPSPYDNMWDMAHSESFDGNAVFSHVDYDEFEDASSDWYNIANAYDCKRTDMDRGMANMHWGSNTIRDNQGGWMQDKPRGAMIEIDVWGRRDYSTLNEVDASFARFFWALGLMVPNCFQVVRQADETNYPCVLEELFIDLNTNYSTPAPLGTYNPGGGELGTAGHPKGEFTWATGGSGDLTTGDKRIYIRRVGDWLVAINCANAPSGYDQYAPTHLSATYTPRDPEDIITPTEFAQLVTDGVLDSGYTLTHYDPATYHNPRVTTELQRLRPEVWDGFQWGPDKAHPDDVDNGLCDYKLSTAPFMLRDRTLNDGSTVNTSANYTLGPLEAVIWKIS